MTTSTLDWDDPFGAAGAENDDPDFQSELPVPLDALRPVRAEDKRVILGETDIFQLAPFAYPWAWEFFLNAKKNNWTPLDVNMNPDVACYRSDAMGDKEKHIFDTVFSQLVTFDMVAMRNLSVAIIEKLTAPEMTMYINQQASEESVHVWTYQHVIESLGLPQDDIYNRYRTVPELHRKVKMTNDRLQAICDPYIDLSRQDNLDRFLMSYIFFAAIFEGLFFYHGFTPIFSLQRRGLMTATGEQLQYIMRDESLHFQFGIKTVNQIMIEQNHRPAPQAVQQMFEEAEAAELAYAEHLMPEPVIGYSAETHIGQFRYLANIRARSLGYTDPFPGAVCTTPWLDEQVNVKKEKNFFEQTVQEYQNASALKW